jgi:hypothetical protein
MFFDLLTTLRILTTVNCLQLDRLIAFRLPFGYSPEITVLSFAKYAVTVGFANAVRNPHETEYSGHSRLPTAGQTYVVTMSFHHHSAVLHYHKMAECPSAASLSSLPSSALKWEVGRAHVGCLLVLMLHTHSREVLALICHVAE